MADTQANPQAAIEPEADDYDETDSALGVDNASSTTSLSSTIFRHRHENGRTYHAFKGDEQIYAFPNDDPENERLDMQHQLFHLTFEGRLFLCPIPKEKYLSRVLDIGCGTGIWAIDFADSHPESEVTGVDLSPIQPGFVPPNLMFQIDDIEESWTFNHKFDFIHSRMMVASIKDWPALFAQIYNNLNPGGYIELADICFPVACDDDTLLPSSSIRRWADLILQAGNLSGRICNSPVYYKAQLEALGFVGVTEIVHKWPQNRWPRDRYYKELGMWNHENFIDGLEALSMGLFTRVLGWLPEEVTVFLIDVRKEMKDTKIHAYYNIYSVYAMKPYTQKITQEVEIELGESTIPHTDFTSFPEVASGYLPPPSSSPPTTPIPAPAQLPTPISAPGPSQTSTLAQPPISNSQAPSTTAGSSSSQDPVAKEQFPAEAEAEADKIVAPAPAPKSAPDSVPASQASAKNERREPSVLPPVVEEEERGRGDAKRRRVDSGA